MYDPERGPFFVIPDFVFDLRLTPHAFRVYGHLKCRYDGGQLGGDGVRQIARHCGISGGRVRRAQKELLANGLIQELAPMDALEASATLKLKAPNTFLACQFNARCAWCKSITSWLHDHHFPIPRSEGGTETVAICPNCHSEFHALIRARYCIVEQEEREAA